MPKPACVACQSDCPNRFAFTPGVTGAPGGVWDDDAWDTAVKRGTRIARLNWSREHCARGRSAKYVAEELGAVRACRRVGRLRHFCSAGRVGGRCFGLCARQIPRPASPEI